jgi:hypothetical protein
MRFVTLPEEVKFITWTLDNPDAMDTQVVIGNPEVEVQSGFISVTFDAFIL